MESVGSIIAYIVLALSIMVFSVLAVTTRKILRSATFLLFALFATAAVYFMLGYQFLGGVQIAVYAGGIVVLFVFSILLTSHPGDNSSKLESKKKTVGLIGAVAMFVVCAWSLISRCSVIKNLPDLGETQLPTMKQIGHDLMSSGDHGYLLPFEAISVLLLACIIGGIVVARKK
ncbi:MAG: NADH-quinone oxidoreductase subunit J [Muribaculaceae bacterium]|nr:NADH-quinone oxidoreductase subunit J [Muribaculaceae bacterium]